MAYSLVKDDPGFAETARLWGDVRGRRQAAALAVEQRHRRQPACVS